jgi:hypothetical protein
VIIQGLAAAALISLEQLLLLGQKTGLRGTGPFVFHNYFTKTYFHFASKQEVSACTIITSLMSVLKARVPKWSLVELQTSKSTKIKVEKWKKYVEIAITLFDIHYRKFQSYDMKK